MRHPLLPVLLLCGLLAACGASTADAVAPASSAPAAPGVQLLPRPRDLDLTGVDACALLGFAQRREFAVDKPAVPRTGRSDTYGGSPVRSCSTGSTARASELTFLVSDQVGIEAWTGGQFAGEVTSTLVKGFPAITAMAADPSATYCTVVVDVGPHRALDVRFGVDGGPVPSTPATLCANAQRAATAAMTTITDTLGR